MLLFSRHYSFYTLYHLNYFLKKTYIFKPVVKAIKPKPNLKVKDRNLKCWT